LVNHQGAKSAKHLLFLGPRAPRPLSLYATLSN
jgi:hypothetical protein